MGPVPRQPVSQEYFLAADDIGVREQHMAGRILDLREDGRLIPVRGENQEPKSQTEERAPWRASSRAIRATIACHSLHCLSL